MKTLTHSLTLAAALLALSPAALASQGVSLASGLTDFTAWRLFGDASAFNDSPGNGFNYSTLRLTAPGIGGQAGAGFAPVALNLDFNQAFSFDFNFFVADLPGLRGDGMTFTLAASPGVGGGGSDLGYGGLGSDSLAFAIDTFHFDGEALSPSVQILQGGNVTPLAATETGLGDAIRDPNYQWRGMLDYAPSGNGDFSGLLTGTIWHLNLGSFAVSAAVDFNALGLVGVPIFYGFTAGNGLATDGHFVTSAAPVPEPGSLALMLAGLAGLGWVAARRRPSV